MLYNSMTNFAPMVPTIAVNSAPPSSPNKRDAFAPFWIQLVDQNIDTNMDAGAHAVSRAKLRHPDEHVDAKFLRPGEMNLAQIGIEKGDARSVAMKHRDKNQQRCARHQRRNDNFLESIKDAQKYAQYRIPHSRPPGLRTLRNLHQRLIGSRPQLAALCLRNGPEYPGRFIE